MSTETIGVSPSTTENYEPLHLEAELAGVLGINETQVLGHVAVNRQYYRYDGNANGQRVMGKGDLAIYVQTEETAGQRVREIIVDHEQRPLSEAAITVLGAEALLSPPAQRVSFV
jgi:hypothetical protein